MRFLQYATAILVLALVGCKNEDMSQGFPTIEVVTPTTRMDTVVEDYHGVKVEDPYRWLEDDTSAETGEWVKAQNEVTYGYIDQIPFRDKIRDRLEQVWNYEKYGSPFKEGDKYYYFKNDGLQNQYVLYAADSPTDEGVVVLDPNKFSDDGTASLGGMSFNKEGNYLAYFVSEGGSDWRTGYVKDMSTGDLLDDKIEWAKFSGLSWQGDGFYYSRYPEPKEGDELSAANEYHAVYFHKLGTEQSEDKLIYVDNDYPQRNVYAGTTEDERFVILSKSESTSGNALSIIDSKTGKRVDLVTDFDHDYSVVDNDGSKLLLQTNVGAPKNRVVSVDLDNPAASNWQDFIPESDDPLRGVSMVGGKIFATYMHDASSLVKVFDMDGKFIQNLDLPGIGSTGGVSGKKEQDIGFYSFTSFTRPSTIYQLDVKTLSSEVFRKPDVDFDSDAYETVQEWYTSKDGTKVPMFITRKKGLEMDGVRPTLLYGYGGFDIPITPSFSLKRIPLLENGGMYVVANIRGGGEFGKDWHQAGTKERKQNVFDDFIAAAEYLIDQGYTTPAKLAIEGRSNGGLLVGATMTQRPDLFAVAFPHVGVLDMLRYHEFTIGWAWAADYGRSDDPEAFKYLMEYSPLHNVEEVAYPATMVATADHDDRVVPAHSFKFISELQRKHQGPNPVLIRVETSAGHGAGKPTSMQIDENADYLAFMLYNMDEGYNPIND
jgi:prolyl oligopeptidase